MNRRNLLLIIVVVLLLLAIPLVIYILSRPTNSNTHAASAPQTASQPETSQTQTNLLAMNGWTQTQVSNVTVESNNVLQVTTPKKINWYYVSNPIAEVPLGKEVIIDFQASAHSNDQNQSPEIYHLHLVAGQPNFSDQSHVLPNEVDINIGQNNALSVATFNYHQLSNGFARDLVIPEANGITQPANGHIHITLSGFNTNGETITITDPATNNVLVTQKLPYAIFTNGQMFFEVSVENTTQSPDGAVLTVKALSASTQ